MPNVMTEEWVIFTPAEFEYHTGSYIRVSYEGRFLHEGELTDVETTWDEYEELIESIEYRVELDYDNYDWHFTEVDSPYTFEVLKVTQKKYGLCNFLKGEKPHV